MAAVSPDTLPRQLAQYGSLAPVKGLLDAARKLTGAPEKTPLSARLYAHQLREAAIILGVKAVGKTWG